MATRKASTATASNKRNEAVTMPVDTKDLVSNIERLQGRKVKFTVDISREAFEASAFPADRLPDADGFELVDVYRVDHVGDPGSQVGASLMKEDADILIEESRRGSPGVGFVARPTPEEHQNVEGAKRHHEYIQKVMRPGGSAEVGNAALLEHIAMLTRQVAELSNKVSAGEANK